MSKPKKENDWGFWEFLHKDRYFVELEDGTRLRANSEETVTLYEEWTKIDKDFLNSTFNKLVNDANNIGKTNFKRIWDESVDGNLDFKNNDPMNNDTLYLANGVLYNRNEAGNFVWAYFLESKGYGLISGLLAQGGSLFGNYKKSSRFDELHDVKARHAGQRYYHSLSKQKN
jgi:hypothetical protein